jgi:hypothetical chaperone protein
MNTDYCGLDFGTSNSTIGLIADGSPALLPVEGRHTTLPSAIFFSFEDNQTYFGRQAIAEYIDGAQGRLMRSLKSVLGTSLIHEKTRIKAASMEFSDILGLIIARLKACADTAAAANITRTVLGRPVHFVDGDAAADAQAQNELEKAARKQGFKHIEFQFEPIAAALDYEQQVRSEKLALIADIGGGTSDFSIVRVSPQRAKANDRRADILANCGVHIGGTDLDRMLSMARVMPQLGYRTANRNGKQELPTGYFFDLATWHFINQLYKPKVMLELNEVRREAVERARVERLIALVQKRKGHALASKVEAAKILLTSQECATIGLELDEHGFEVEATRIDFEAAIAKAAKRIRETVQQSLAMASITASDIQAVFLTGGSSQIPLIRRMILQDLPGADVVDGDAFGSVGLGLTLEAQRKFGRVKAGV